LGNGLSDGATTLNFPRSDGMAALRLGAITISGLAIDDVGPQVLHGLFIALVAETSTSIERYERFTRYLGRDGQQLTTAHLSFGRLDNARGPRVFTCSRVNAATAMAISGVLSSCIRCRWQ